MKLSNRDRIIVAILLMAVVIYGGYNYIWTPLGTNLTALKEEKTKAAELSKDITPLVKETEKLTLENNKMRDYVENARLASGNLTATNEDFLVFLGDSAAQKGVSVTGFKNLEYKEENGIYKAVFDFELRGSAKGINEVVSDMADMGIKCSVGSMSYRKSGEYDYLKRFFDDLSDLKWYKEPDKEEENKQNEDLPEEDIPEIQDIPEYVPPVIIPEPTPEIVPDITPAPTPTPKEEPDRNINDRLDKLLEQTAFRVNNPVKYKTVFLTNTTDLYPNSGIIENNTEMRLAVTVCLVMFNEPSWETSIITNKAGEESGIL